MSARLTVEPAEAKPRSAATIVVACVIVAAAALMITGGTPDTGEGDVAANSVQPDPASLSEQLPVRSYQTLDRTTGFTAVVLTATHLELIDLDTAEREIVPLPRDLETDTIDVGRRLLLQGDALLIPNGAAVWSLDLATGAISDLGPGERVAPSATQGNAWILAAETATWREVDSAARTVRTLTWPDNALPWDHGMGTPEISWLATGGVFRLQSDSTWSLVAQGVPMAGNNNLALTKACSSLETCTLHWISTETGEVLDRPAGLAFEQTGFRSFRLSPSGSAVLEMNPTSEPYRSVFVYRDGIVRATSCGDGWRTGTWSADETLLACVTRKGMAVTDVSNGPVAAFEHWDKPVLGVVLVETSSLRGGNETRATSPSR